MENRIFSQFIYDMSAEQDADHINVRKNDQSDWVRVAMTTNGRENGKITIRSKEMAEQLHFMLGQMLGKVS